MHRGITKSILMLSAFVAFTAMAACSGDDQGPPPPTAVTETNKKNFEEANQKTKGVQPGVAKGIKSNLK
ncbi:MAG: hypothetical protein KGM43_00465 [Planctomycetota bacterium]|nr:hypothetical protein [Planctomycetota bacterium]